MVVGSSNPNPPSSIPIEISSAINRLEEFDRKRKLLDRKKDFWGRVAGPSVMLISSIFIFAVGWTLFWGDEAAIAPLLCGLGFSGIIISFLTPRYLLKKRAGLGFFEDLKVDDAVIDLDFVNRYSVQTGNYSLQGQLLEYYKGIASYAKRLRNTQAAAVLGTIIIGAAATSAFGQLKK